MSTLVIGHEVRLVLFFACVPDSDCQATASRDRQVNNVVTDVRHLFGFQSFFFEDFNEALALVGEPLVNDIEFKIASRNATVCEMRLVMMPSFSPPSFASEIPAPSCALKPFASITSWL